MQWQAVDCGKGISPEPLVGEPEDEKLCSEKQDEKS